MSRPDFMNYMWIEHWEEVWLGVYGWHNGEQIEPWQEQFWVGNHAVSKRYPYRGFTHIDKEGKLANDYTELKKKMCKEIREYGKITWEDKVGYPKGLYDSFEEMIVGEFGDESEQAKKYNVGMFKKK